MKQLSYVPPPANLPFQISTAMRTVSIAMGTYNGAGFIAEQLASFARQTVLPSELVVTDDGSTDNTLDVVAAFAAHAPFPVHIERNVERLGYRANFMKAAGLCGSDFIAFSDQDDIWLPHKLETCLVQFHTKDVLLVYHNATIVTETLEPMGSADMLAAPQVLNPPQSLDPFHFGWGLTLVFRRALLNLNDLWPMSLDFIHLDKVEAHDQWFCFLASSLGTIAYIEEPLVLYRQHGNNTFGWNDGTRIPSKIYNLLSSDIAGLKSRQYAAEARASILEQAQTELIPDQRFRAVRAAAGYRNLVMLYHRRHQMYLSGNILSRSAQCVTLLWNGAYQPKNQWGVGRKALLRDLVCGVFPLERWLKRC
jgi:glycosyltransferase involved in cell wall biosynthesis